MSLLNETAKRLPKSAKPTILPRREAGWWASPSSESTGAPGRMCCQTGDGDNRLVKMRPRILIVAQNASSLFGGEAILPLKYFQLLKQRGYRAKLIAHERNRSDLERVLQPFKDSIYFVKDSIYHKSVWRAGSIAPQFIQTIVFGNMVNLINESYQARIIRRLVAQGEVDIIHQPIPVSPVAPSTIYGFGVPVVIGPMNGGMTFPPGYQDYESKVARHSILLARKAGAFANWVIPGKRRAASLLVANARTRKALPVQNHPKIIELVENGVDLSIWRRPKRGTPNADDTGLRLIYMGRLVQLKALDITLEAVRLARDAALDVRLDILGDGPERPHLERRCDALGVADAVRFLGFRPQSECVDILNESDALILNCLRECGGAVVLEAMSLGLPVIASDWGGPADYLDESCGILVSPVPRSDFPRRLSDAISLLARDPAKRHAMGRAGAKKVRDLYDWEKKVVRMLEIYAEVLEAM